VRRAVNTLKGDTVGVVWNSNGITTRFGEGMIVPFKLLCTAVHYLIMIGFVVSLVAGLWRRDLRREKVFLGGVILLMAVPFVFIVVGSRYHLCMMPFLIVWGGARRSLAFFANVSLLGLGRLPSKNIRRVSCCPVSGLLKIES
jgi:hypothetical protein